MLTGTTGLPASRVHVPQHNTSVDLRTQSFRDKGVTMNPLAGNRKSIIIHRTGSSRGGHVLCEVKRWKGNGDKGTRVGAIFVLGSKRLHSINLLH